MYWMTPGDTPLSPKPVDLSAFAISGPDMRKGEPEVGVCRYLAARTTRIWCQLSSLMNKQSPIARAFGDFANIVARAAGRPSAFLGAFVIVLLWGVSGPLFGFSDTWQLVINTGTTIVTFLMVFLIQNSQNRDNAAIQVKLDEIIRAGEAKNSFVGIEHLTEDEIVDLRTMCEERAKRADSAVRRIGEKAEEAADAAA
jgi:low affinity Fe/Cu permease